VYPFIKTRDSYARPKAERQTMMDEHVRVGRKYPSIRLNTTYSYGLDDQEFIVAFEGDDPAEFLDLVMELRESQASSYTLRDTPTFTCVQMSLWDMLDTLGGAGSAQAISRRPTRADGYPPAATLADLPPDGGQGGARRCHGRRRAPVRRDPRAGGCPACLTTVGSSKRAGCSPPTSGRCGPCGRRGATCRNIARCGSSTRCWSSVTSRSWPP